jgi:RNA polymerase sigma factor (sigma-70 family)
MRPVTEEQGKDLLELVRYKVWKFTRGRQQPDPDDLVQEVVARVLEQLPRFDPGKATLPTFQNRLIERACVDCLRRERAAKRGHGRVTSLDRRTVNGHSLHDQIDGDRQKRATGKQTRTERALTELVLDVKTATAKLQPEQQVLCEKVQQMPISEVAKDEHVSRGTVYRRIKPVRETFENLKLAEYLE